MNSSASGRAGDPAEHSLVFIGGLHRSGTTPLTRLLGKHPQVSSFRGTGVKEDEGQHLQMVYPSARTYGGAGRFAFAEQSHLTEGSALATPANGKALFDSWARHWDLSRPCLVEKSPPNLLMTRFLQALFPSAKFVIIVRHPIVVALSTRRWAGPTMPVSRLVEHWLHAHETFLADAAHLNAVHVIKYERLMSDPEPTLSALTGFLNLENTIPSRELDPARTSGYLSEWDDIVHSRRPWRRQLPRRLQARYGGRAWHFGYNLLDLSVSGPWPNTGRTATEYA